MQPPSVRRAALFAIILAGAIAGAAIVLADPASPVTGMMSFRTSSAFAWNP